MANSKSFLFLIPFIFLLGIGALIISLLKFQKTSLQLSKPRTGKITLPQVEIADNFLLQSIGLMGREKLGSDGMLFIFDKPRKVKFWMFNTKIPLDLLFFDGSGTLVEFTSLQPGGLNPFSAPSYSSKKPAQCVLEVPKGFCSSHSVFVGKTKLVKN